MLPYEIDSKSWRKLVGTHTWRSAGADRERGMKGKGRD